jgi:hypothetical protein
MVTKRFVAGALLPAFALAAAVAMPVYAQGKAEKGKPVVKELVKTDKVTATEATYKPGDASDSIPRPFRVTRALKGGTIERIFADGKKEKVVWKTGEVRAQGPDPAYIVKNVGKTDIVFYVVYPK